MSVIQFLIDNRYSIPRFCYHGLLSIAGNCRVCVIDDRESKTSVSCALCYETYRSELFNDGAIVGVYVKNALAVREHIFEFLLLSHPLDCPICDRGGECELQDMTNSFGSDGGRSKIKKSTVKDKYFNIAISTHMSRCITCGRCVRFLREITNSFNLGIVGRGNACEVSNYVLTFDYIDNIYAGNIIDLCPVTRLNGAFPYFVGAGNVCEECDDNVGVGNVCEECEENAIKSLEAYLSSELRAEVAKDGIVDSMLPQLRALYFSKLFYKTCRKYKKIGYLQRNIYMLLNKKYSSIASIPCMVFSQYKSLCYESSYIVRLYYSLPVTYHSRKLVDDVYECVLCACCSASCPSVWWNGHNYLGPAILLQTYKWVVGSSDSEIYNRINNFNLGYNLSLCHGIGNCKVVCPKNLDPASRISDLKSLLVVNSNVLSYI